MGHFLYGNCRGKAKQSMLVMLELVATGIFAVPILWLWVQFIKFCLWLIERGW